MAEINDILTRGEEYLNSLADDHQKRILRAIQNLEKRIIDLAKELPSDRYSLKFELKKLQQFHRNLVVEFGSEYGTVIDEMVSEYSGVEKQILSELKKMEVAENFTTANKKMFSALKDQAKVVFTEIGTATQEKLTQAVYDATIGGGKFSTLVDTIRNNLTGIVDKGGRPMASYASTFAQDSVMEYSSKVNLVATEDSGLDHFIYYGNIVGTSRPFCIARAGRIYTRKKIENWNEFSWKGKKPGNVWFTRGGYNCRHHFRAVNPKWIENGKLDIGNYFDENPDKYNDKLRKEVEQEKRKLFLTVKKKED